MVVAPKLAPTEVSRRWAALLQQSFEVDPLVCPHCAGAMRIVAFITQSAVIDQILMHLRMHPRTRADSGIRPGAAAPRLGGLGGSLAPERIGEHVTEH